MNSDNQGLKPSTRWSAYDSDTWGPYWDVLFPPRAVTPWINWKRGSTGVGIARNLWAEREYLRRTYESVYGTDPAAWASQHPGVILAGGGRTVHAGCLRCHYFVANIEPPLRALDLARRHETSDGDFRDRKLET